MEIGFPPRPSYSYLVECLEYLLTGQLRWKKRPPGHFSTVRQQNIWNAKHAGKLAGTMSNGYVSVGLDGRYYKAHVLIWVLCKQYWPAEIDHVNMVQVDNRIDNLREATRSQNMANARKRVTNSSGYKGVSWSKQNKKWMAQITVAGTCKYLGCYSDLQKAAAAYKKAAAEFFGAYARVR